MRRLLILSLLCLPAPALGAASDCVDLPDDQFSACIERALKQIPVAPDVKRMAPPKSATKAGGLSASGSYVPPADRSTIRAIDNAAFCAGVWNGDNHTAWDAATCTSRLNRAIK